MKTRILIYLSRLFGSWHRACLESLKETVAALPPKEKTEVIAALKQKVEKAKTPPPPRARRTRYSNWDAYASQYERNNGPSKPLNPVEREGVEVLRNAKEQHQNAN